MNLKLELSLATSYTSNSQIARVLTETWVANHMFCPRCGHDRINRFRNNMPVSDFSCPICNSIYELKSKNGKIRGKISDGAYRSMITRITSNTNPDFFFMSYSRTQGIVNDLIIVPKYFFTPAIIEKRPPLADTARRAGWTGCNILLQYIPQDGRIYVIKDRIPFPKENVVNSLNKTAFLENTNLDLRGWLLDVMNCISQLNQNIFTLDDMYQFEGMLSTLHPNNKNIQAKIRQKLQVLRDKGYIEFLDRGKYRKR